jgi:ADP-ribosyl-[dinitrogen reductase] hydrolase
MDRLMEISLQDRYLGCLLGLACGDAVGTSVEFSPRGSFPPLTDLVGGGPFELPAGKWTDDTSMALCLAASLLHCHGFDARDQMTRYVNWWRWGYLSSTDRCFDIGMTVQSALSRFLDSGDPIAGSRDRRSAGNGSLMRLAPVVLFYFPDRDEVIRFARESSATTHGAAEAEECCVVFAALIAEALAGKAKSGLVSIEGLALAEPAVREIAAGSYLSRHQDEIRGTGYCVKSLEAALWCFQQNDNFAEVVLQAANLGDDADTTAAIAGQIAGAHYGASGIPAAWLAKLHMRAEIEDYAQALMAHSNPAPA